MIWKNILSRVFPHDDPKIIDTLLLSVAADELSKREWDWITLMKSMSQLPAMVAGAIVEQCHVKAAVTRLQDAGD